MENFNSTSSKRSSFTPNSGYTDFSSARGKSNFSSDVIDPLRERAVETGLFEPVGNHDNLARLTDRMWDESEPAGLTSWMSTVIDGVRGCETEKQRREAR